jgi:hypothetical protein
LDATGLLGKRLYLQLFTARLSFFTQRGQTETQELSSAHQTAASGGKSAPQKPGKMKSLSKRHSGLTPYLVVSRLKAGQSAGNAAFIHDGKADVDLLMNMRSEEVIGKLKVLGFEVISWPVGSTTAVGRIPIEKLESLLGIDGVLRIGPHIDKVPM